MMTAMRSSRITRNRLRSCPPVATVSLGSRLMTKAVVTTMASINCTGSRRKETPYPRRRKMISTTKMERNVKSST